MGSTLHQLPGPPAVSNIMRDTLHQSEYVAFRDLLPTWRDRLICMMLRNTGLRINELLRLETRFFELGGPEFFVYSQRLKSRNRDVPYEPHYLNANLGVQMRDYIKSNGLTPAEMVFGQLPGQRDRRKISARGIRFVFGTIGKKSIGRPVMPKDFRSFWIQTMIDGGVPLEAAAKMAGHDNIRTTQEHYYRLSREKRRAIGEGIPV